MSQWLRYCKSILINSENVRYCAVPNILSSRLLPKTKIITLRVALYGRDLVSHVKGKTQVEGV